MATTPRWRRFAALLFLLVVPARVAPAQTVEVVPLAGYRFGGDLFEIAAGQPLDIDGAPVIGGIVNVSLGEGMWFEGLFTHQQASVAVPLVGSDGVGKVRLVVQQWLAGGRQDLRTGAVLPFLTGLVGITRYGREGDNEIRFAVSGGGGVKVPLASRLALRLESRVFTTIVDFDARAAACGGGACLVGVDVSAAWQLELAAELAVAF